ncbi:23S RNA-specific pseudouridylate synthase [Gottschalkia purinilytica]|uniref:Pseudouridine synthase n=1 Tax=Gottschalkia purinilytica TaxID=1503 RepID=A0A0L0WFE7_GOTPU|nr:RluA family pseudouridine synthase [Gottschalkia purinilytica]KNF10156.1 23S RNA-specific pseudouridylate synthase [Gottschalkia purinilytica]
MKEIVIDKNEHNQRIDRFLKKYLSNANKSFIYKMLRKKRIKLNGKKANPEDIVVEGDKINLYLSEETIDKFKKNEKEIIKNIRLDIIYEDDNIILINKPKGMLSHSTEKDYKESNIVDQLVGYLYAKGEYVPRLEKTFTPSICNRLDRNTSGLIIGAKNFTSLQLINKSIKEGNIKKYYKCIVKGNMTKNLKLKGYLKKNEKDNKVVVTKKSEKDSKEINTDIKVLKTNGEYTLLEIDLITGRTHQIRAHLSSIGHPIIGDTKYGNVKLNRELKEKYKLKDQFLHAYKIVFNGLEKELEYLNEQEFTANMDRDLIFIEKELFNA